MTESDLYKVCSLSKSKVEQESAGQSYKTIALFSFSTANSIKYYVEKHTYDSIVSVFSFYPKIGNLENKDLLCSIVLFNSNDLIKIKKMKEYKTINEFMNKRKNSYIKDARKVIRTAFSVLYDQLNKGKCKVAVFSAIPKINEVFESDIRSEIENTIIPEYYINKRFELYFKELSCNLNLNKYTLKIDRLNYAFMIINNDTIHKYDKILQITKKYHKHIVDFDNC